MRFILALMLVTPLASAWQPADSPPLGGPKVREEPARPTIITRNFDGSVKPPEGTAEEAVLDLLGLGSMGASPEDHEAAERVRVILAKRGKVLEDFVFDNVALLTKLDTAGNTGDKADQLALLAEAFRKLAPLREGGPLSSQIRAALPRGKAEQFDAILREYWEAVIADRMSRAKPEGGFPSRLEAIAAARLESLGREIERSFYRLLMSGEFIYRVATRGLTLTPEQSRRLRAVIEEHYRVTGGNDDEAANRRLFAKSIAVLDDDQKPRFIRNLRELGSPKKAAPAPTPPSPDDVEGAGGG
ncbi:MAG: hypothetical protein DYG92_02105 [Leptolyngbya sp. PLA1]|nr:hypothetical protein [Leptolyngbya sp. PLA1]